MRIPWPMLVAGALAWVGTYALVQHGVPFRPDNWMLFLSASACWLLTARPDGRWSQAALVPIPAIGFHVKATGMVLLAAIALVHLLGRQRMRAVVTAGLKVAVLVTSVVIVNVPSGGAYLDGLRGAARVSGGLEYVRSALLAEGDPVVVALLALPALLWAGRVAEPVGDSRSARTTVTAFWGACLLGATLATTRPGSGPYYFLDAATFGLLPLLPCVPVGATRPRLDARTSVALVALVLACVPTASQWLLIYRGRPVVPPDAIELARLAYRASERFGRYRNLHNQVVGRTESAPAGREGSAGMR